MPMSSFSNNIVTVAPAELIGFDYNAATDAIDGPTIERVTAAPTATRNAGSIALRTDGTLYITTGAGVWTAIGGAAGGSYADDVALTWGTAAPGQVTGIYVSASNRWDLRGDSISQATAASGSAMRIETGTNVITGAVAGNASGLIEIRTGATDSTNAGGTGGASGALTISTGNATSTLGTSGSTGNISLVTGNSDDANSGNIVLTCGTAVGTRGVLDINAATIDTQTQNTQWLLIDGNAAALQIGATGALTMMVFDCSNAAEEIVVNAVRGIRVPNDVSVVAGTTANDRFNFSYSLADNRGQLTGTSITLGGAGQATRPLRIATGDRTVNDAVGGAPASGAIVITSGATDVTDAGGTAGATGAVSITSGNASSTAGTGSGASGALNLNTGTSADSTTGNISIGSGGVAASTSGNVAITTGAASGAGTTGNISLTPGTTVGGTRGQVTALGLRTTSSTAVAITGATVLTLADSGGIFSVSQGAAYDIDLPNPTPGAGLRFVFYLTGPAANNVTITTLGGATFVGTIVNDVTSVIAATGSTLTFASGAAALGDNIEIISISTTLYLVRAVTSAAGGITIA